MITAVVVHFVVVDLLVGVVVVLVLVLVLVVLLCLKGICRIVPNSPSLGQASPSLD